MHANEAECLAAGLDPKRVESIARRINKAAKEAREMGLEVFGGSTAGTLRVIEPGAQLIVADMTGGCWSGGDGSTHTGKDGLTYGEH